MNDIHLSRFLTITNDVVNKWFISGNQDLIVFSLGRKKWIVFHLEKEDIFNLEFKKNI